MAFDLASALRARPWWMNALLAFCLYMTFLYLPYDLFFKPVAADEEVWFGFVLRGWWAKATAPLHWLIYAAGAYGFWRMAPWMWPWAAIYCGQVVVGMVVWNVVDERGGGWLPGLVGGALFLAPAVALWRSKARFRGEEPQPAQPPPSQNTPAMPH